MDRDARLARVARGCLLALLLLAPTAAAQSESQHRVDWQPGPRVARLGSNAEIAVPDSFLFADKKETQKLLEATHNIVAGNEVGCVVPAGETEADSWFVLFQWGDIGYVKDDERESIDADKLMASLRESNIEGNKERRKRGWHTLELVGWERTPHYDPQTHNLTWAIRVRSENGSESVNHSVRILGRKGTMDIDLVLSPDQYAASVPRFDALLQGFRFQQGHRYADFIKGDKVATYGLTALIAGGAGAVAVKSGLLAKSWKVLVGLLLVLKKGIIVVLIALFALFKRLFSGARRMFSGRDEEIPAPATGAGTTTAGGVMESTSGSEPPSSGPGPAA